MYNNLVNIKFKFSRTKNSLTVSEFGAAGRA